MADLSVGEDVLNLIDTPRKGDAGVASSQRGRGRGMGGKNSWKRDWEGAIFVI